MKRATSIFVVVALALTCLGTMSPGWHERHSCNQRIRAGTVTMAVPDGTTKEVAFSTPFPNATTVRVFLQPQSGVAVTWSPGTQTTNGFTMTVSLAVAATFNYVAIAE